MKISGLAISLYCFLRINLLAPANGQDVLWASKVLGFSSELRPVGDDNGYRSKQILGKPNKLPASGDSPCAWTPANPKGLNDEWIKVGFEKAILLKQIAIAENFYPGAIAKVYAYDVSGKEYLVAENKPLASTERSRMYRIFTKKNNILCNAVKIVLQPSKVPGSNQIDAIGISSDITPIEAKINLAPGKNEVLKRENLGKAVNSSGMELAPVISSEGRTLYFTRAPHPGNIGNPDRQDIWVSKLERDNEWSNAVNIGAPLNTSGDNAVLGLSPDNKKLYLINKYRPDGAMELGLSYSISTRLGWGFPQEMQIPDLKTKPKENIMEVAVSSLGNVLLIALQKADTYGKKDIYVSALKSDNTWSDLVNIGSSINSAADEAAPFLALDNKTLYFSSAGHSGYGDSDLFMSQRLDDSWLKWSEPVNLGPVFNSPKGDVYFSVSALGDYGYFCSGDNSMGHEDIFRVRLTPENKPEAVAIVTGVIYDSESKKPLVAELEANYKANGKSFTKIGYDPSDGEFRLVLPVKESYQIYASQKGYFPATEALDFVNESNFRNIKKNLYLQPIKVGLQIRLSNTMFGQSSARLDSASYTELNKIVETMSEYPSMEILLEGHTDNQGEIQKNIQLSQQRVTEVKAYLIANGIAENRIQTKAWGPSKPIASNETELSRQKNRRVEFTILKI